MKVVVFGNSGSGKTTYAGKLKVKHNLAHLDLDTIAWEADAPPKRRQLEDSRLELNHFMSRNRRWVIEGCYSDLLLHVLNFSNRILFLNPGVEACIANAKQRPWEPHKYSSMQEQNKMLPKLIEWIREYYERSDEMSYQSHLKLFRNFEGTKEEITELSALP